MHHNVKHDKAIKNWSSVREAAEVWNCSQTYLFRLCKAKRLTQRVTKEGFLEVKGKMPKRKVRATLKIVKSKKAA